MDNTIPDFIVHYNRGEPFRSITSLCRDEIDFVLKNLNAENAGSTGSSAC